MCAISAFNWENSLTPTPRHFCQCPETFLLSQLGGGGLLLASSAWRPGVLLNILQCTGQPAMTKNDPAPNVKNTKVVKPCTIDD